MEPILILTPVTAVNACVSQFIRPAGLSCENAADGRENANIERHIFRDPVPGFRTAALAFMPLVRGPEAEAQRRRAWVDVFVPAVRLRLPPPARVDDHAVFEAVSPAGPLRHAHLACSRK